MGEIEGAGVVASSTEAKETPAGGPERDEASFSRESMAEVFAVEMQSCRELIEIEPSCRWPRLQLLHMIEKLRRASLPVPGPGGGDALEAEDERRRLLGELLELDPTHAVALREQALGVRASRSAVLLFTEAVERAPPPEPPGYTASQAL